MNLHRGIKRLRGIGIALFLLTTGVSFSQSPQKMIRQFKTPEVSQVSIDRLGNLYLILQEGIIRKYDTDGNFTDESSNPDRLAITLVEPWNPLRVFVYCREKQKITLLDHHLGFLGNLVIDPAHAIDPFLASPSVNNFWIFDRADNSMKKIDHKSSAVIEEVSVKAIAGKDHDFTFLREYQNLLFLIDRKSGIYILSNLGKLIHTFPVREARYLGFLGQEIYYLENGTIWFYDLYSEETRHLAVDPSANFVLVTDERMILIKPGVVEFWEYKP